MSEYQYYEFRAIDRPLTEQEIASLRAISGRAHITSASFVKLSFARFQCIQILSSEDDAFAFESSSEIEVEPEFDGGFEDQEFVGDTQVVTVPGEGRTGWSVAVSLIAPFAAIALSDYTVFEDGSVSEPAIERFAVDDDGSPINPEGHFREVCGQGLVQKLEKLRTCIVGILEKHGVTVLPKRSGAKRFPGFGVTATRS